MGIVPARAGSAPGDVGMILQALGRSWTFTFAEPILVDKGALLFAHSLVGQGSRRHAFLREFQVGEGPPDDPVSGSGLGRGVANAHQS